MSYLNKDLKSELASHLTRCNKKSFLAFSINSILSGEQNNNKDEEQKQEEDPSKDEVGPKRELSRGGGTVAR